MDLDLKGRTALITGGSKGIGYAIAEQMAGEGCNVILAARNGEGLTKAKAQLGAQYPDVSIRVHSVDLSTESGTTALAAAFPDIDILVNNAGAIRRGALDEITDEMWRGYWDLKVFGYINLTRSFYALMKARRRGVIINIIGMGGERLPSNYIAGGTGNAALIAFTKSIGGSSARDGIRVVGVNPGAVLTDKLLISLRKDAQARFGDPERWEEITKDLPFGRTIRAVEVSALVALLASDLSGYTTGTVFNIDGGILYRNR